MSTQLAPANHPHPLGADGTNPLKRAQVTQFGVGVLIVAAALLVRLPLLEHVSRDMDWHNRPWFERAAQLNPWAALGEGISNYPPGFDYVVLLTSGLFHGWVPAVLAMKLVPLLFDGVCAGCVYWLVRRHTGPGWRPLAGLAGVLFAPTVILNSAMWGQVDAIFTAWLLLSVCLVLAGRPGWACVTVGLALGFKPQAFFLAPFFVILLLRGLLPGRYVWVPAAVYLAVALPAALAGRPVMELLTAHISMAGSFERIGWSVPNLYMLWCLVPGGPCFNPTLGVVAGGLAVLGILALVGVFAQGRGPLNPEQLLVAALLSLALLPFLLPNMHERYFYAADVLAVGVAFYRRRLAWLPFAFQLISLPGYGSYLLGTWNKFIILSSLLNLATLLWLSFYARRLLRPTQRLD